MDSVGFHSKSECPTLAHYRYRIRQVDLDDNLRIWRNFKMGKLFDLIMLDTRNYDGSITSLD